MSNMIGIDPGLSGAIAIVLNGDLYAYDMPCLTYEITGGKKRREVYVGQVYKHIMGVPNRSLYMEAINGRGGRGFTEFRFGECYGMLKATIALTNTSYTLVSPQKWKNYFGLKKTKGMTTAEFKTLSRELAMKEFPERAHLFKRAKDDGRAEAALIAKFGLEMSNERKQSDDN